MAHLKAMSSPSEDSAESAHERQIGMAKQVRPQTRHFSRAKEKDIAFPTDDLNPLNEENAIRRNENGLLFENRMCSIP